MSTAVKNKKTNVARFLDDLRPEGRRLAITTIPPDGGATTTQTFANAEAARDFIVEQNAQVRNVYYTLNVTAPMAKKPKKGDIVAAAYLHVDADPAADETSDAFKERMRKRLKTFEPQPTFTIDSGNGLQLLWELNEPLPIQSDDDIAAIESRNHALALQLGANPSTRNIDRLLRVPGTINYPNATKRKAGRVKCRSRYLDCTDASYSLNDFTEHVENEKEQPSKINDDQYRLPAKLRTLLLTKGEGGYHSRSELLLAFLTGAIRAGIDDDVIVDACLDPAYAGCGIYQHIKSNGGRNGAMRQLAHAREMAKTDQTGHSWDDPDRSLLDDRRGNLPKFPVNAIRPKSMRDWIRKGQCYWMILRPPSERAGPKPN